MRLSRNFAKFFTAYSPLASEKSWQHILRYCDECRPIATPISCIGIAKNVCAATYFFVALVDKQLTYNFQQIRISKRNILCHCATFVVFSYSIKCFGAVGRIVLNKTEKL